MSNTVMTDLQRRIFDLERSRRYKYHGRKAEDVAVELGITMTRFYQVLEAAIATEEASREDPAFVTRQLRLRNVRRRERSRSKLAS